MQLAIKVDVDTRIGLREGVPRLLDVFRRRRVCAAFFVSFGPDHSGRAIRRVWRPSFLLKMMRTNPCRLYGVKTLLSGTLLPSKPIGEENPGELRAIVADGHELGIHGYDHVRWQDKVEKMDGAEIEAELKNSIDAYRRILGKPPLASAAPGWRSTPTSLAAQDRLGFDYASDVRGTGPFFPVQDGRPFHTLQIPTTLPTLDELIGRERRMNDALLSRLEEGLNVHTIHAEVEGRVYLSQFEDFLDRVVARRVETVLMKDAAEKLLTAPEALPRLPVKRGKVSGRSGWVSCQGADGNRRLG